MADGLQVLEAPVRGLVRGPLPDASKEAILDEVVEVPVNHGEAQVAAVYDLRHPDGPLDTLICESVAHLIHVMAEYGPETGEVLLGEL